MTPVIAFTSGKGGCGKTTLAANFANVVAQAKAKVLIIDFDLANRGASGLFSKQTRLPHERVTTTRLLRDDLGTDQGTRDLIEVKSNIFLIPASSPNELAWDPPDGTTLQGLVADLRGKLQEISECYDIDCVVLDCFCGIDVLTTAAAAVAEHTILVNEPDVITFTGTVNLINHLQSALAEVPRPPQLHIVINRLKSTHSVRRLAGIYRDNLHKVVNEIVLAYFPYHRRIFESFGNYPFISDLLPRSLFVRKLELLTLLLFIDRQPQLVKSKVRTWSKRKIKKIYSQSIDRTAVDADYLVIRLTSFPILLGLWLVVSFVLLRIFPLGPALAWTLLQAVVLALSALVAFTLVPSLWLAARLNFSVTKFRYLFAKRVKLGLKATSGIIAGVRAALAGVMVLLSLTFLCVACGFLLFMWLDYSCNLGFVDPGRTFENRVFELSTNSPVRAIDLRDRTVSRIDFRGHRLSLSPSPSPLPRFLDLSSPALLTGGTEFTKCTFYADLLVNKELNDCKFDSCRFVRYDPYVQPAFIISASSWRNVQLSRTGSPSTILFESCQLDSVTITMSDSSYIGFHDCGFSELRVAVESSFTVGAIRFGEEQPETVYSMIPDNIKIIKSGDSLPVPAELVLQIDSADKEIENIERLIPTDFLSYPDFVNYPAVLSDQIARLIVTLNPRYVEQARELQKRHLELSRNIGIIDQINISHLLRVQLDVIQETEGEVILKYLSQWMNWCESTGYYNINYTWDWEFWNRHLAKWY
ncbi:MAG: AAA family ATPase, partial [Candidatus Zixiibacteriota bacterium]